MRVFGIAGFKNSGKTTLIVELLREFNARGLNVATIKHAHHDFDIDHPGKDSYLHREAGASEVIVTSARRWAHIRELNEAAEPALAELLQKIGPVDLVLIEGFKREVHAKIEVRRAASDDELLAVKDTAVKAIVCDGVVKNAPVQVLDRANLKAIADFILAQTQTPVSGA